MEDPEDFNDDEFVNMLTPEEAEKRRILAQRENFRKADQQRRMDMDNHMLDLADEVQKTSTRLEAIETQLLKASAREVMMLSKVQETLASFLNGVDEKIKTIIGSK